MDKYLNEVSARQIWAAMKEQISKKEFLELFLVRAPVGTIVVWSGSQKSIPAGWHLCDGTDKTPDLRNKFILGAGDKYGVGDEGDINASYDGSSEPSMNMPPYYALCYIMKTMLDETDGATIDEVNEAIEKVVSELKNDLSGKRPALNMLDNYHFLNPINRNGKAEYTGGIYGIDRWHSTTTNQTVKLEDGYISLTEGYWRQDIKHTIQGEVTISVLARGTGTIYLILVGADSNATYSFPLTDSWEVISKSFDSSNYSGGAFKQVVIRIGTGGKAEIISAKLELGSTQTLAHKEGDIWVLNEIPNYAEQYAICEQYSPITGEFIGSQHSNTNLLDNHDLMNPINQKGQEEYTGLNAYGIDRWATSNTTIVAKVTTDGLQLTESGSTDEARPWLFQSFENLSFNNEYVTFSALITCNVSGKFRLTIRYKTPDGKFSYLTSNHDVTSGQTVLCSNTQQITGTIPFVALQLMSDNLDVTVKAVKLELGPVQTLAHKEGDTWVLNDPPPNYQQELAKCQRYQLPIDGECRFAGSIVSSGTQMRFFIPTPVTMMKNPTITGAIFHGVSDNALYVLTPTSVMKRSNGIEVIANMNVSGPSQSAINVYARVTDIGIIDANL